MRDEIEINLKVSTFVRDGRCCKSARCNIQGNVPPVIQQWGEFETDLAYYLGPHMQRLIGISHSLNGSSGHVFGVVVVIDFLSSLPLVPNYAMEDNDFQRDMFDMFDY